MFSASMRLTKKDFETLKTRLVYRGVLFDVAIKEDTQACKIACIISKKKIKQAVDRNKVRRRILHSLYTTLPSPYVLNYILIYPKAGTEHASYHDIDNEIKKAFATL